MLDNGVARDNKPHSGGGGGAVCNVGLRLPHELRGSTIMHIRARACSGMLSAGGPCYRSSVMATLAALTAFYSPGPAPIFSPSLLLLVPLLLFLLLCCRRLSQRRDMSESVLDVREAWDECAECRPLCMSAADGGGADGLASPSSSGRPFMVRGQDYMKSKVKIPARWGVRWWCSAVAQLCCLCERGVRSARGSRLRLWRCRSRCAAARVLAHCLLLHSHAATAACHTADHHQ